MTLYLLATAEPKGDPILLALIVACFVCVAVLLWRAP